MEKCEVDAGPAPDVYLSPPTDPDTAADELPSTDLNTAVDVPPPTDPETASDELPCTDPTTTADELAPADPTTAADELPCTDSQTAANVLPAPDPKTTGYLRLLNMGAEHGLSSSGAQHSEIRTTPLFSNRTRLALTQGLGQPSGLNGDIFPQFGVFASREETYNSQMPQASSQEEENIIFTNMNAPWSVFLCGSQGSGKSHSMSCLLENSLLSSSVAGENPNPLAGIIFHYDKFTGAGSTQLCEAAYLCSSGIPVRVLVSPTNYRVMRKLYSNLPGLPPGAPKPQVIPLHFQQSQLNVARLMTLMAINSSHNSLYMEVVYKVLRDLTMERHGAGGIDYLQFTTRLASQGLQAGQLGPLRLRLDLVESYLADPTQPDDAQVLLDGMFDSVQGSLTIVDLSCPFVNEADVCALFSICLTIFMENRAECGRIVALDEAHKFLTKSGEAEHFTDQLTSIICQQRHLGTRVVIATQEPTLAPRLLDLCNMSIIHRFSSPAWFTMIQNHIAGAHCRAEMERHALFKTIVGLRTGQALIFCPSALLDVDGNGVCPLKDAFVRVQIRARLTADGGRSIMASDDTRTHAEPTTTGEFPSIRPLSDLAHPMRLKKRAMAPTNASGKAQKLKAEPPAPPNQSMNQNNDGQPPPAAQSEASTPRILRSSTARSTQTALAAPKKLSKALVKTILHAAVKAALLKDSETLSLSRVREAAAAAAGMPLSEFCKKVQDDSFKALVENQITLHMKAYKISRPKVE